MEALARLTGPKVVALLCFSVVALPVILLAHVFFVINLAAAIASARRSPRLPDPECEPLLLPLDPEFQALPPPLNDESGADGLPVDNMTAQSYVYGLGEGTSPSPGHRPVTRPARTWDYVVRVLTAWPPTRTESHNNEDERRSEEDAPV